MCVCTRSVLATDNTHLASHVEAVTKFLQVCVTLIVRSVIFHLIEMLDIN